jgi:transglutaminase-like putative cysteine protease
MASLVDTSLDNPEVIDAARALAVSAGPRRPYYQALAIAGFLQRVWRFVDDPNDRDTLRDPVTLLREYANTGRIAGDCDEAAILGAALGRGIGLSAQFYVLGFASDDEPGPGRLQHVFAVLLTDDGRQVSLDVTRPAGPLPVPSRIVAMDV